VTFSNGIERPRIDSKPAFYASCRRGSGIDADGMWGLAVSSFAFDFIRRMASAPVLAARTGVLQSWLKWS